MHRHSCSCIDIVVILTAWVIFTGLIFSVDVAVYNSARDYADAYDSAFMRIPTRAAPVEHDTPAHPPPASSPVFADTHSLILIEDLMVITVCRGCFGGYSLVNGVHCDCASDQWLHVLLRPNENIDDIDRILWPGGDRRRLNVSAIMPTKYIQIHGMVGYGAFIRANGAYITA